MGATLDGQALFDEEQLEIERDSYTRDHVERAIPGLDGLLSIDLGGRGRTIRQKGVLRAKSRPEMSDRISSISVYMDGDTHKLVVSTGEEFDDLQMHSFKLGTARTDGIGLRCNYEIIYRQLRNR
jgi:hypothetical protein